MSVLWPVMLGVLVTGYLVLDGAVFGVGMVLALARDGRDRTALRAAVGPYFLGGEVWVVAAAGLLAGAFPRLEDTVLAGHAPLVVLVLGALLLRDAGMWMRERRPGMGWRRGWDTVLVLASAVSAVGWGLVLGALLGVGAVCAPAFVVLLACHGAAFAVMRTSGPLRQRARRVTVWLAVVAAVALAGAVLVTGPVRYPVTSAVAVGALVLAGWCVRRPRAGWAFACTTGAVVATVLAAGAGQAGALLAGAADPGTLRVLAPFLLAALPVMAGAQLWLWLAFRGPVRPGVVGYF